MSKRTKEIASRLLEQKTPANDVEKFLHDIEDHLQALKFQANNSIEHRSLINKEIPDFLRDVFPEMKDFDAFLLLLEFFGLNRGRHKNDFFTDAYVFFDREKSGFLMVQQPFFRPLDSIQRSYFCLLCQRDENGDQILSLAGVNGKRILTARYEFSLNDQAYVQKSLDIGVDEEEIKGFDPVNLAKTLSLRHFEKEKESLLITETMLRKVPFHNWLLSPGSNLKILERIPALQQFAKIPRRIPTRS